ncbi:MAG: RNA polymerase sigma-70 factor [Prevotella sp.]|jgi:RNA polymerase sigma-70 factor (ECF subfamily)|nr:RNA polymerase sigma-70 factor [Prevotella sp.]
MKRMLKTEDKFRKDFENIYLLYDRRMIRFAEGYVGNKEEAENIVHDTFADIWESRGRINFSIDHMPAILFTSLKNKCIDYLRHQIVIREAEHVIQETLRLDRQIRFDALELFHEEWLLHSRHIEERITQAIDSLPNKCREIFVMSRLEGKKQKEIAKELHISIHTIEAQMQIAYKKLKEELKEYLL